MIDRHFTFLGANRAAIAMDTQPTNEGVSKVTLAIAFCNHRDQFQRRTARNILNGRIDDRLSGSNTRLTFQANYVGTQSRKDVMYPVLDVIRENLGGERDHVDIVRTVHAVAATLAASTDPALPVSVS